MLGDMDGNELGELLGEDVSPRLDGDVLGDVVGAAFGDVLGEDVSPSFDGVALGAALGDTLGDTLGEYVQKPHVKSHLPQLSAVHFVAL